MAKGASKSAGRMLECQEVAGEYRRIWSSRCFGRSDGYGRSRPSCTVGPVMILIAGSMICSTSSPIPAFLLVAWDRVRGNKGARTAGVDGQTAYSIEAVRGVEGFLDELRSQLKDRSFRPLPVRERMIPKAGGKLRRLGIAAVRGSGGPGVLEAGVGADLRGGFPPVLLRVPPEAPGS